jgi:hypothetical protein
MSLSIALGTIGAADFDHIYQHLRTHAPSYANMHLRRQRTHAGKSVFRYLHAMRVKPGPAKAIEGMISGPEILWSYEISRTTHGTAMKVVPTARRQRNARGLRSNSRKRSSHASIVNARPEGRRSGRIGLRVDSICVESRLACLRRMPIVLPQLSRACCTHASFRRSCPGGLNFCTRKEVAVAGISNNTERPAVRAAPARRRNQPTKGPVSKGQRRCELSAAVRARLSEHLELVLGCPAPNVDAVEDPKFVAVHCYPTKAVTQRSGTGRKADTTLLSAFATRVLRFRVHEQDGLGHVAGLERREQAPDEVTGAHERRLQPNAPAPTDARARHAFRCSRDELRHPRRCWIQVDFVEHRGARVLRFWPA